MVDTHLVGRHCVPFPEYHISNITFLSCCSQPSFTLILLHQTSHLSQHPVVIPCLTWTECYIIQTSAWLLSHGIICMFTKSWHPCSPATRPLLIISTSGFLGVFLSPTAIKKLFNMCLLLCMPVCVKDLWLAFSIRASVNEQMCVSDALQSKMTHCNLG